MELTLAETKMMMTILNMAMVKTLFILGLLAKDVEYLMTIDALPCTASLSMR